MPEAGGTPRRDEGHVSNVALDQLCSRNESLLVRGPMATDEERGSSGYLASAVKARVRTSILAPLALVVQICIRPGPTAIRLPLARPLKV